jgi:succinate dehydrogenase/fumarate reductase cytochrome b subunit
MKKYFIAGLISSITGLFLFGAVAYAQTTVANVEQGINTIGTLIELFNKSVVKALGTLFLSAGVVLFFYGIVEYIWGVRQGDSGKVKNGQQFILWALIALFVMFSVYGIITFFQGLVPGLNNTTITIPEIILKSGGNGANGTRIINQPLGGGGNQGAPTTNTTGGIGNVGSQIINSLGGGGNQGGRTTNPSAGTQGSFAAPGADCSASSDCGSGMVCQNFKCAAAPSSGTVMQGADCTSDAECGQFTCYNFRCQ